MSIETDFGNLVKTGRARVGWSQSELAQRPIPIGEAVTLAALLRIDLGELKAPKLRECPVCHGTPPKGFTCNECKLAG